MVARALRRLSVGASLALGAPVALAVPFNVGGWQGQFDSRLSFRNAWALEDADAAWLGRANGGQADGQWHDDGRLNYRRGEAFEHRLEGEHALELLGLDQGFFLRGRYWHDKALADLSNRGWPGAAGASGAEWLDAFYVREFKLAERAGLLRAGRQRLHWSSARFLGINPANPEDRSQRHDPFTALERAARPIGLLFVSQELGDRLALEAFQAWEWQPDLLPGCGSFLASSDVQAGDCSGFDIGQPPPDVVALQAVAAAAGHGYRYGPEGVRIPRARAGEPDDGGQFGLALRWRGDSTDYRLQYVNFHSQRAFLGLQGAPARTRAALPAVLAATADTPSSQIWQQQAVLLGNASYRLVYPEDVRQWSASASGALGNQLRWTGELSFRPNAPVQQSLRQAAAALAEPALEATRMPGYRRHDVTRLVLSLAGDIEHLAGADALNWIIEAGHAHVGGAGSGVSGIQAREATVSANAWGYRLLGGAEYRNVWPRIDLLPRLGLSHDVRGHDPDGLLSEGAKALMLGLGIRYLRSYQLDLTYTAYQGGQYNALADRDWVSVDFSIAF